jgi:hypothetical protein
MRGLLHAVIPGRRRLVRRRARGSSAANLSQSDAFRLGKGPWTGNTCALGAASYRWIPFPCSSLRLLPAGDDGGAIFRQRGALP